MTTPHDLKPNPPTPDRKVETRSQELREQAAKVSHEVRELGGVARAGAESTIHSAKQAGEKALENARERGEELLEKGRDRVTSMSDGLRQYVSENPLQSLVIAAGIGGLIGCLAARR